MAKTKSCKDCPPDSKRPAPNPGPRCATHWRVETKRRKAANHDRMVCDTYGLNPGEYQRLYDYQGGYCAICKIAKGTGRRRLAVDHDHSTGEPRGLLCSTCNQYMGWIRDNATAFRRGFAYLHDPPIARMRRNDPPLHQSEAPPY